MKNGLRRAPRCGSPSGGPALLVDPPPHVLEDEIGLRLAAVLALVRAVGLKEAHHVAGTLLSERSFAERTDGLRPSSGENLLVATT
jgi:hypothetical protein